MASPAEDDARSSSPTPPLGLPRAVSVLEQLPFLASGLVGSRRVMRHAVQNATALLNGRVDPNLAAVDQAIPTWVIAKAKARSTHARAGACNTL